MEYHDLTDDQLKKYKDELENACVDDDIETVKRLVEFRVPKHINNIGLRIASENGWTY